MPSVWSIVALGLMAIVAIIVAIILAVTSPWLFAGILIFVASIAMFVLAPPPYNIYGGVLLLLVAVVMFILGAIQATHDPAFFTSQMGALAALRPRMVGASHV